MKDVITPFDDERRFAADLAHELRTPIAASKILAQLALGTQNIQDCHEYLEDIVTALGRVSHTITQIQLLTSAHPENVLKERTDIQLKPMVNSLAEELALITDKKLHIDNLVPHDLTVFANEGCMRIVLRNLLDNAIRYSPGEPIISVAAERQGAHVQIAVSDQGPGIPPELRARVLDRFYRKPGTEQLGCGLGLSIVAQICKIQGDTITLHEGDGGRGLKVVISLASTNTTKAQSRQTERML